MNKLPLYFGNKYSNLLCYIIDDALLKFSCQCVAFANCLGVTALSLRPPHGYGCYRFSPTVNILLLRLSLSTYFAIAATSHEEHNHII